MCKLDVQCMKEEIKTMNEIMNTQSPDNEKISQLLEEIRDKLYGKVEKNTKKSRKEANERKKRVKKSLTV